MTDKIGIDEQIAHQEFRVNHYDGFIDAEILATLRDYKRIQEAKKPDPVGSNKSEAAASHVDTAQGSRVLF